MAFALFIHSEDLSLSLIGIVRDAACSASFMSKMIMVDGAPMKFQVSSSPEFF